MANLTFKPTKKDLSSEAREIFGDNATITERGNATKTNLPLADTLYNPNGISDKGASSSVCFAYIYQLKDDSIKIIVKLDKTYAEQQMEFHPSIARSKFPKGKGWYVFKIDGTFDSMDKVMKLISQAHQYVALKGRI